MEQFGIYAFVGLKEEKKENIATNISQRTYFIREVLDTTYVCDVYSGEDLVEKHSIIKLSTDKYEIKKIKATYKIREYYPATATWVDRPQVFGSVVEIKNAVMNGEIKTQFWEIWGISIYCDSDCKKFGIDPTAPWPPKAI